MQSRRCFDGLSTTSRDYLVNLMNANVQLNEQFRRYCDMEINETKVYNERTMSQENATNQR